VVREEGDGERVAVHGGFVQVEQNVVGEDGEPVASGTRVTLLIGVAELAEEIDVERARVALDAAEARVSELGGAGRGAGAGSSSGEGDEPDAELVQAEAELLRAQVRLEAVDATASSPATA
jgi:F0F1-type ATP synthase epsilon subunit